MAADPDCPFCKIVAGKIPAAKVYEDDATLAFQDLDPQAPVHVLVVPKQHLRDLTEVAADAQVAATLLRGISATATELGLQEFRTVLNTGAQAGQSVWHVHAHVLGGRPMGWPPG
jgi:histidine triad (HIT) family protein